MASVLAATGAPAPAQEVALHDDFESGLAGWSGVGLWNPESSGDLCGSLAAPFPVGTGAAWWGGGNCNFQGPPFEGRLTRNAAVRVPASWQTAWLDVWTYADTEWCWDYDLKHLFVSTDGGGEFELVDTLCVHGVWHLWSIDLTRYIGADVTLRFEFEGGDGLANEGLGWLIDDVVLRRGCEPRPTTYCATAPNSVGAGARIGWAGSTSTLANDFHLTVVDAPPAQYGKFYYGPEPASVPFGDGLRCVGAGALGTFRLYPPVPTSAAGTMTRHVDLTEPPAASGPGAIVPGSTWYFQFWYRDPSGPGGSGFNLSDGLAATFCL